MSQLYAIHAFENAFGGLHGIEDYAVIEAQDEKEVYNIATEMSSQVIDEFEGTIMEAEGWEEDAINEGLEENTDEFWDYIDELRSEDIAYSIYKLRETNESLESLNEQILSDPEEFLEKYAIEDI